MSEIFISFDKLDSTITDNVNIDFLPFYFKIIFYNGNDKIVYFNNLNFEIELISKQDNSVVFRREFPLDATQQYESSDQSYLESAVLPVQPEQEYKFKVVISESGQTFTRTTSFTTPRPKKPYESWLWNGNEWQPPVKLPIDDYDYYWDESLLQWVKEPDYDLDD